MSVRKQEVQMNCDRNAAKINLVDTQRLCQVVSPNFINLIATKRQFNQSLEFIRDTKRFECSYLDQLHTVLTLSASATYRAPSFPK